MDFQKLELLAPAGRWDVLEQVIKAGADAVYLGDKEYNMRILRQDFNFSVDEIKAAAVLLHEKNKKLYITVNNLYNDQEIDHLKEYLLNLNELGVDGFIVQDMGIVQICKEMGLSTPLHASVQMGIASVPAAKHLEELGFARAIFSKNLSLEEITAIYQATNLEMEFFVHGDLCIAHTGQCHLSSFITGQSSNRGCCVKPCRWQYALSPASEYHYLLAGKDLCLYPYLAALINAGVVSFKIEGRMRDKEYLSHLVSTYRHALDQIITDPEGYQVDPRGVLALEKNRIRNFTTGNLWGKPDHSYVDSTGTREPKFISQAVDLQRLNFADWGETIVGDESVNTLEIKELAVKINSLESAAQAIKNGADKLIVGWERYHQIDDKEGRDKVQEILAWGSSENVQVWLETPRIVTQNNVDSLHQAAEKFLSHDIAGVIANDYGSLLLFRNKGYPVMGGVGLNITNHTAAQRGASQGMKRITPSPELDINSLASLFNNDCQVELIVQGPLCGLITDYCFFNPDNYCENQCCEPSSYLWDKKGQAYVIRTDYECRNYLYHPFDLCLYKYLPALSSIGLRYIRIDGQFYNPELLGQVTAIYKGAIDRINAAEALIPDDYKTLINLFPRGLTSAPLY